MKDLPCSVVPIHKCPELKRQCCKLINAQWPRSEAARLRVLNMSCDEFPTCLVLIRENSVVGHCKISLIPSVSHSIFVESVVIDRHNRSQGLGSMLMEGVEDYARMKGITKIYLKTKGQEKFYLKNGYSVCEPINLYNFTFPPTFIATKRIVAQSLGPPPPPMPTNSKKFSLPVLNSSKTFMMKRL